MKIAIAGYGLEGKASLEYWQSLGETDITVFDQKIPEITVPDGVPVRVGEHVFEQLQGFDLVIRTASLRPDLIETNGMVWSATNEFFEKCPASIIGVTGTKGKGTTCSLIAEILRGDNKTVHLLGNIGVPALDILPSIKPEDIVVFELSSFQLWDLTVSPDTAVVLMIEPDHQDVHNSVEEYVDAKSNITKHQTGDGLVVYHPSNRYSAQVADKSPAIKKRYMTPEGAYIISDQIVIDGVAVSKVEEVGLIGGHNLENVCAAITATWKYSQNVNAVQYAIKDFKGLPHRLELVRELDGVRYINDSYSSMPGATIAAIKSFSEPEILICGGFDRGLDYTDLAKVISEQENIKKILLIGDTKEKIAATFDVNGIGGYEVVDSGDLNDIVVRARSVAQGGDIVLFSPGCASFDMFRNFQERGERYRDIVEGLQ